jgi:hypothetical protein
MVWVSLILLIAYFPPFGCRCEWGASQPVPAYQAYKPYWGSPRLSGPTRPRFKECHSPRIDGTNSWITCEFISNCGDDLMRSLLTSPFSSAQQGVMVPVVPDPEHPEYTVYWVRDSCRVYHEWLNELTVPGPHDDTKLLRALVDDGVHALIRT